MTTDQKVSEADWRQARQICASSFLSSLHFSISSINGDGTPHVTPIGSLRLLEPGTAIYFEIFTSRLSENLEQRRSLCILGVNSSKRFWVRSLWSGRFSERPGVRMVGVAGQRREATREEVAWWQRRVRFARRLRGYEMLWGTQQLRWIRELTIVEIVPVALGAMTADL